MESSQRTLRLGTLIALVLLAVPLQRFVVHTSRQPVFLGRYSRGFFVFLVGYLAFVMFAAGITWVIMRADKKRLGELANWLSKIRSRKPVLLMVLLTPWLLLVGFIEVVQEYAPGRSALFQFSFLALIVLFNLLVLLAGRPQKEVPDVLGKTVFVAFSVGIALIGMEFALRQVPALIPSAAHAELPGGGMFLQKNFIFDKPIEVGYRYEPFQDRWLEYRTSSGDLYQRMAGKIEPLPSEADRVLARIRLVTDENGYVNTPPLKESYEIVVSGDSMSVPETVADPWPRLLEEAVGKDVLNLALSGYSVQAEVNAVQLYGLEKGPSWVIIGYFEGNDLVFESPAYDAKRQSGLSWIEFDQTNAGPYASSVALQSLRYGIPEILQRVRQFVESRLSPSEEPELEYRYPMTVQLGGKEIEIVFFDHFLSGLTSRRSEIESSKNWGSVAGALVDLKRASDLIGAQLLIVYLPSKEHVYLPLLPQDYTWHQALEGVPSVILWPDGYLSSVGGPPATGEAVRANMNDQRDVIAEFAEETGAQFLDLTPGFQMRAAQGEELYYEADTHWNQEGHDLAAQLIADFLTDEGN